MIPSSVITAEARTQSTSGGPRITRSALTRSRRAIKRDEYRSSWAGPGRRSCASPDAADRDVSEFRGERPRIPPGHRLRSFNALRQDFVDLRQDFADLRNACRQRLHRDAWKVRRLRPSSLIKDITDRLNSQ